MSKTGRNAPCPCGSGKKLKKCCGPGKSVLRPVRDARPAPYPRAALASHPWAERQPIADPLDRYFRAVEADSPHDAEQAAREMLARFPERIDGHERLAEVFGARGDHALAAKHFRCAAAGMTPTEPNYDPAYVPYLLYRVDVHSRLLRGVQATRFDELTDSVAGDLIRGDLDEAAFQIEVLFLRAPGHHVLIERRGQLREIHGDRSGAASDFREAAALARRAHVDDAHVDYLTTRANCLDPPPPRS